MICRVLTKVSFARRITVRGLKRVIFLTIVFVSVPVAVLADVVIFKSGVAKEGVIQEETPTTVKIKVKDVVIGISRSNIERIERATPQANQQLEEKWKEEKERLAEERAKKREAEAKLEAEQKTKGLVNVDGKWVSPAEAERMRQDEIRKQAEGQAASPTTGETPPAAETSEETPAPEILDNLPPELQQQARERLQRQKSIQVSQIQVESRGSDQSALRGTVVNKSDFFAQSVDLEITSYGDTGEVIDLQRVNVANLGPGESKPLNVPIRVDSKLIKRTATNVASVNWR